MYLFGRTRTINPGRLRDALSFAGDITAHVREVTGLPVSCYNTSFGNAVGTLVWSTVVRSQEEHGAAMQQLLGDDRYLSMVESAEELFVGTATDELRRVIQAEGRMDEPPPIVQVITAQTSLRNLTRAMQWGAEMQRYVHGVTGLPGLFLADTYGAFGQVTWIAGAEDMAAVDAAADKLAVDPGYIQRLEEAEELYRPGSGRQGLLHRIA